MQRSKNANVIKLKYKVALNGNVLSYIPLLLTTHAFIIIYHWLTVNVSLKAALFQCCLAIRNIDSVGVCVRVVCVCVSVPGCSGLICQPLDELQCLVD